jgi:glycosyltransferase involved in cell wall biosynthesis
MKIGFEAKRVFENTTGLGNATRGIVNALLQYYPQHQYHLFAPKQSDLFPQHHKCTVHTPTLLLHKTLPSFWRSSGVVQDIKANAIDVYIGLAAELPNGLQKLSCKKVVFVHDLIFERYPQQYNSIDVKIYRTKTKYACAIADVILVNSTQTKQDLIDYYNVQATKIEVVYLDCNAQFYQQQSAAQLLAIQNKYTLPEKYFLSVGSIIHRKGLLTICQAYAQLPSDFPALVVIGNGNNNYATQVKQYIQQHQLQHKIIFLNQQESAQHTDFKNSVDFPAIYQNAIAMVYPSIFEGFGLPILEAMASGLPVITSNVSCMPEVGGGAAIYINPTDPTTIAAAMQSVYNNSALAQQLKLAGIAQAQNFTSQNLAIRIADFLGL